MVHSDTILNEVLEVWAAEKILKARRRNGVLWRSLKLCFVSWKCWKQGGTNGGFWRYLKRCFGSWNCLKKLKVRKLNVAFWRYSKNMVATFRGASKCGNMFITKKPLNNTISYNVKLVAFCAFLPLPTFAFWADLRICKDMSHTMANI